MTSPPLHFPRGDGVGTEGIGWVDSASGRYQIKLTTRHAILAAPLKPCLRGRLHVAHFVDMHASLHCAVSAPVVPRDC
jgi:hypothetical protein